MEATTICSPHIVLLLTHQLGPTLDKIVERTVRVFSLGVGFMSHYSQISSRAQVL